MFSLCFLSLSCCLRSLLRMPEKKRKRDKLYYPCPVTSCKKLYRSVTGPNAHFAKFHSLPDQLFYFWLESFKQEIFALGRRRVREGLGSFRIRASLKIALRFFQSIRVKAAAQNLASNDVTPCSLLHTCFSPWIVLSLVSIRESPGNFTFEVVQKGHCSWIYWWERGFRDARQITILHVNSASIAHELQERLWLRIAFRPSKQDNTIFTVAASVFKSRLHHGTSGMQVQQATVMRIFLLDSCIYWNVYYSPWLRPPKNSPLMRTRGRPKHDIWISHDVADFQMVPPALLSS